MTLERLTKNQERDLKNYLVEGGEEGFSEERNKAVIEATIQKHEANRRRKLKEQNEQMAERIDAAATYLTSRHGASSGVSIEKYFGRQTLAYLQGQKILDKISLLGAQEVEKLTKH